MTNPAYFYGTGKRKTAIARVRLLPGGGAIIINGKPLEEAFPHGTLQSVIVEPLRVTGTSDKYNAVVKIEGGGNSGQAGAIRHGIARALLEFDETLRGALHKAGYLTRDARKVERKKVGLHKARKRPQYSKR